MLRLENDKSLDSLTTFHLRAKAAAYAEVRTLADLKAAFAYADARRLPVHLLGGGANTVAMPKVAGLVLRIALKGFAMEETADAWLVHAAAGETLDSVVSRSLEKAGGLENLAAIPGTIGGAVVQNVGAYGLELADRFESCRVFNRRTGEVSVLDAEACDFAYRSSVFKDAKRGADWVVIDATLRLPKAWQPVAGYKALADELERTGGAGAALTPQRIEAAVRAVRARKLPDPARTGNAGSFFKNPIVTETKARELLEKNPALVTYAIGGGRVKLAAGWLIEAAGLKGFKLGEAAVSPQHALILINAGHADGRDVKALAAEIERRVMARYGVKLEPEPVFIGE